MQHIWYKDITSTLVNFGERSCKNSCVVYFLKWNWTVPKFSHNGFPPLFYKSWRSNLSTTFKLVWMYIKFNSLKPQFPGMLLCSYTKYLIMVILQNTCPCYLLGHFPVFIQAKYWYTPFLYQPQLSTVKWFQSKLSTLVSTLKKQSIIRFTTSNTDLESQV